MGVACIVAIFGLGIYGIRKAAKEIKHGSTTFSAASNGGSVVSAVRTINTAEITYSQAHSNLGYTCSLSELSGAWGISSELAAGKEKGYVFELRNCVAGKPRGPISKYQLVAYPEIPGKLGAPAYCSDESDVIRIAHDGSAENCLQKGGEMSETEITHPDR